MNMPSLIFVLIFCQVLDSLNTKEEFIKRIPLNRIGKVSEISAVVRLLSSKGGSYITGQNIKVDGGITRSV